jgi:predicted DCC family thiol-disulfide oxidoreductase YuxK
MPRGGIIYFDGECNLCNGFTRFVMRRDHRKIFKYQPLQSDEARKYLSSVKLEDIDSVVFADQTGQAHIKSQAVITILGQLGGAWRLAVILRLIPRSLRDWCYDWIARNRKSWFGTSSCTLN